MRLSVANLRLIWPLTVFALPHAVSNAATLDYGVSVGIGVSDNIDLVAESPRSESMVGTGITISAAENGPRLKADVAANLFYVEYLKNAHGAELTGEVQALAIATLIQDRMEWLVQDNFGQVTQDPFQPVNPGNRENINYLTTGPDLSARLGASTRAKLSGRYSRISYENAPLDSQHVGAGLALLRELSTAATLSMNFQTEGVQYDIDTFGAAYHRHDAFLTYAIIGSRTAVMADMGYSSLNRDDTSDNSDGILLRMNVTRQLSRLSELTVRVGREFSDAGSWFRVQQGLGDSISGAESIQLTAEPFKSTYVNLGWNFQGSRTGLGVGATGVKEEYLESNALDRKRITFEAYLNRRLTPHLRFELRGTVSKEDAANVAGDYRDLLGSAVLSWRGDRKLGTQLRFDRSQRRAESLGASQYHENRAWLRFTYGTENIGLAAASGVRPKISSLSSH